MLELIFVMVILGILTGLAIPRLNSSKDEAQLSKSLNDLRTLINDISIYTLKNGTLGPLHLMTNVSAVENVDFRDFTDIKEVNFRVGDDKECIQLLFINRANFILMGISSNQMSKNAIINLNSKEELQNLDFTSSSSNKSCVALSKNETFKHLATQTYLLVGHLDDNH